MINSNYDSILGYIYQDELSIKRILSCLNESHIDIKLSTVRFIIDLFNNSQQLQNENKERFFSQFVSQELLSLLIETMISNESMSKINENPIKEVAEPVVNKGEESNSMEILGGHELDPEYEVCKLPLLKIRVAEILTNCFQILPSKVS